MGEKTLKRLGAGLAIVAVVLVVAVPIPAAVDNAYSVDPLVSDVSGAAPTTDSNLVNPWGLTASSSSPWWVANNGTDKSTLYDGNTGAIVPLVVQVDGGPTGIVFNGTASFVVQNGPASGPARFIFASEDGKIRGWNPAVSPSVALVGADRSSVGANYKGLAIAQTTSGPLLYAADFHNVRVDVFDGSWNLVGGPGAFVDQGLPAGYAPFGIQTIGSRIFVSYAKQDEEAVDEVAGQGFGFVDVYDIAGNLIERVAQHGQSNAPWGLARAPASFGRFGGELLVGNFGDGEIKRLRGAPKRALRAPWRAPRSRREATGDRRPLGARIRQWRYGRADGHALLHRWAGRREPRALRLDHSRLKEPAMARPRTRHCWLRQRSDGAIAAVVGSRAAERVARVWRPRHDWRLVRLPCRPANPDLQRFGGKGGRG